MERTLSHSRRPAMLFTVMTLWSMTAAGQERSLAAGRGPLNISVGAIVSYQPEGYDGTGGPYLDNSLGGVVPGLAIGVEGFIAKWWLLAGELSTTTSLQATQSGRFVPGGGPAPATHRDTLVSLLTGSEVPIGALALEFKGGISLALGKPEQGDLPVNRDSGRFGLTLGVDGVARLGQKLDLVPSFRYTHVWRGEDALYVGLGDDIIRAGLGVRVWL